VVEQVIFVNNAGGGGSGAYVNKTYVPGDLSIGSSITVVVGSGGTSGGAGGPLDSYRGVLEPLDK
jgi:hypothetical protein